jgi:hypothetical protein
MVVETDLVGSVIEVAVTVTVPPGGTVRGAVKVDAASLVVAAGLNEPHWLAEQVRQPNRSFPPVTEKHTVGDHHILS